MLDTNRYEALAYPADLTVTSLVFRSQTYYEGWIEPKNGTETTFPFHCSACDNPATQVSTNKGYYSLNHDRRAVLHEATQAYGGIESESDLADRHSHYFFISQYAYFIRCRQCQTSHLVVLGYTEHQPSRDVYKVNAIFTIA